MLNEADSNQDGGKDRASEKLNDAEAIFGKLKKWVKADYNSKGQVNWRREAREDFDFEAGEQLSRLRRSFGQALERTGPEQPF